MDHLESICEIKVANNNEGSSTDEDTVELAKDNYECFSDTEEDRKNSETCVDEDLYQVAIKSKERKF